MFLVGGGARSGKSRFALSLALQRGPRRTFIATAQAYDDEMQQRIARHREERAGQFRTLEAATDLPAVLAASDASDVVVIDCLTLYLSNLLLRESDPTHPSVEPRILAELDRTLAAIGEHPADVVVVSNEVGMGIVPMSPLGRAFRDLSGRANQLFAARADEVYFAAFGLILQLRPDPVRTFVAASS
jgi:adenosylcobinamide kinase/adenosylcobinamide-phosphate guanylyltransferase